MKNGECRFSITELLFIGWWTRHFLRWNKQERFGEREANKLAASEGEGGGQDE